MKLLLDTNIFLEVLLAQERMKEASVLLRNERGHDLFLSDFSLHSIGVMLFRMKQHAAYGQFVEDMDRMGMAIVSLDLDDMPLAMASAQTFALDFDDAYQYAIAERLDLAIVSFDKDFDRTERQRATPEQVMAP
jgi:uncharacterized protein